MRILIVLVCCTVITSGCSRGLRTLMRVSKEQKTQASYLDRQEHGFELLMQDIENEKIKRGLTKAYVARRYGDPVLKRQENDAEIFLYRKPRDFFPTQKVYLEFDSDGLLMDWQLYQEDTSAE